MKVLERSRAIGTPTAWMSAAWLLAIGLVSTGCERKDKPSSADTETAGTAESAIGKPKATQSAASASAKSGGIRVEALPGGTAAVLKGHKPETFQIPVGPLLGIFPGKGIGAIRFGASPETVERLMEAKCNEKTETSCRYSAHAVEFRFDGGVVSEIRVHGDERPFGDDASVTYGVFNGRFPQGAALGMYPQFVIEALGEPKRKEAVSDGKSATVERHYYEDMLLEYDKLANGNVVLAGVILTRPSGAAAGKPATAPKKPTTAPKKTAPEK